MKRRSLGHWGWAAVTLLTGLLAASACGDGGNGGGNAPPHPSLSSAGGGSTECPTGSCSCDGGLLGHYVCDAGIAACNCDACGFTPKPDVAFDACGGEPFGTWELQSVDVTTLTATTFDTLNDRFTSNCPVSMASSDHTPSMLLDLVSGGTASLYQAAFSLNVTLLDACSGSKFYCAGGDVNGLENCNCTVDSCGVDSCVAQVPGIDTSATWTRNGGQLALIRDPNQVTFDYCVQGDQLRLAADSGLVYTLRRVQVGGVPTACADRPASACTVGSGCHPACTGGTQCTDAADESSCTNRAGCSWDATQCAGSAPGFCSTADYGVVPGCLIYDPGAHCVGTPPPCGPKTQDACGIAPGCSWGPGCFRDKAPSATLTCSDSIGCGGCNYVAGCGCSQSGTCGGTATFGCESFTSLDSCQQWGPNFDYCSWSEALCNGTPTPCEQMTTASCASTPGCSIEVP